MIKNLIGFLTALCSITFLGNSFVYSGMEDIRSKYTIKDDKLTTYDGKKYSRIPFRDLFHERMAWTLMDPGYANSISRAFHSHLVPTLDQNGIQAFGNALVKACQLLNFDPKQTERALSKALKEEKYSYDLWRANYPMALENFLNDVYPEIHIQRSPQEEKMRVVIITTTSSGGNLSVSQAVKDLLKSYPSLFEVTMIDYETFAETYDPVKIATGMYTKDSIYRMLQQEGFGIEQLFEKDEVCYEIAKYIPYCTGEAIKKHIMSLQPHLIISTRSYYADEFHLLSLGIPFRMLNCDHDICFFHETFIGKVNPEQVKFWLPSASPRFFKQYFMNHGCVDLYNEADDWHTLLIKVAKIANSSLEEIRQQFQIIGYPIRLEFKWIQDPTILQGIRNRWDLRQNEKGVIVEMGANGCDTLEEIFKKLQDSPPHAQPIKYYFVCGRNDAFSKKFQHELINSKTNLSALARCEILGWVEATEMNELMNICSLMIGKPGGATQAELTCLRLPLFIMQVHAHCEEGNREKLFKSHLAYEYDPTLSLSSQIEKTLEEAAKATVIIDDIDWKENLLDTLSSTN